MSAVRRRATLPSLGSRSLTLIFLCVIAGYCLLPVSWLVFAATKSTGDLYSSFGFWFADFNFFENLRRLGAQDGGVFVRWMLNSVLYAGVGGGLSMLISALAGYAFAKHDFAGREVFLPSFWAACSFRARF